MSQICEVIVDIAHANVDRLYSYLIPDGMQVFVGSHVLAPFGSGNRAREGFAIRVFEEGDAAATPAADASTRATGSSSCRRGDVAPLMASRVPTTNDSSPAVTSRRP